MAEEQVVTTTPTTEATNAPAAAPEAAPAPAPSNASQSPATPQAPAEKQPTPSQPVTRSDALRQAMIAKGIIKPRAELAPSTGQQPRDASGKFVSPSSSTTQASTQAASPSAVSLPRSLKKELEAHWKSTHPEMQKAWAQRDADYERGITQYRTQAQQAEALLAELRPYENIMRQTGTDARTMIRNLMPTAAVLASGTPQQKVAVILSAMQQYGVTPEMLLGQQPQQGGQQQAAVMDPTVQALMQRVEHLTNAFTTREQTQRSAEDQRVAAIAEAYGRDKPNFDIMRPQMWSLLQAQATAEGQGLTGPLGTQQDTALWSEQQWIENAYQAALRLDPNHFQSEVARQRDEAARAEREKANQAAQAARAAAVQVRGAPSGPALPAQASDPKDRRSVIAAAMRSHIG